MSTPGEPDFIRLLLARLEHISVDSHWAHRASGLRGTLLRALERIESGRRVDESRLKHLTDEAFEILEASAKERSK